MAHDIDNNRKFLLIADFPPSQTAAARHAARLAAGLDKSGEVITAAEHGFTFARIPLVYKTVRLFTQTLQGLRGYVSNDTDLVVYVCALKTDNIDKPLWRNRRKEEWRRFSLPFTLARRAKSCTVVFGDAAPNRKPFWIGVGLCIALFCTMPLRLRITHISLSVEHLGKRISGIARARVADNDARKIAFALATAEGGANRLSPLWLQGLLDQAVETPLSADLARLLEVSMLLSLKPFPFLQNAGLSGNAGPDIEYPKLAFANETTPSGLSRFAKHHQHALVGREAFASVDLRDDAAYYDWYIHARVNRFTHLPLPVPIEALQTAFKNGADISMPQEYGQYLPDLSGHKMAFVVEILLGFAPRCNHVNYLQDDDITYLAAPVAGISGNLSRLELLCALLGKFPPDNIETLETPWQADEIREWFQGLCRTVPSLKRFSTATSSPSKHNPTFQIIGITEGASGLAQNAQMSAAALQSLGISPILRDRKNLHTPEVLKPATAQNLRRSVLLHHINADALPRQLLLNKLADGNTPLHIGYLLWELEAVPDSHLLAGELLDEIWVPSRFVQRLYERAFNREVHRIGKSISLPDVPQLDLTHFGIRSGAFVFLTVFDAASSAERKNPLAAVRAFLNAFPNERDKQLIIKTTPVTANAWGDPNGQMRAIRKLAAKDPRIVILEEHLPFRNLLSLINSCDCIVSPHRAEGFGYIPAYGLWYEKPVIATDYSGTTDFCTPDTAFPIPYRMVQAKPAEIITKLPDATWADIDIRALAETMQTIVGNLPDAQAKAKAGAKLIRSQYAPERLAARYRERLMEHGVLGE